MIPSVRSWRGMRIVPHSVVAMMPLDIGSGMQVAVESVIFQVKSAVAIDVVPVMKLIEAALVMATTVIPTMPILGLDVGGGPQESQGRERSGDQR